MKKRSRRNGFTMMEALLSLMITSIILMCFVIFAQTCLKMTQFDAMHQEQMAIIQLRQILALSKDIEVRSDCLEMIYRHEKISIVQDKNRLIKKNGYEILMENINHVSFQEIENEIFMEWEKEGQTFFMQVY